MTVPDLNVVSDEEADPPPTAPETEPKAADDVHSRSEPSAD